MPVPTLKELQIAQRKEELTSDNRSPFVKALEQMPARKRDLVLAMLADPHSTISEQANAAKMSLPVAKSAFREIAGKLGPALLRLGVTEADIVKALLEGLKAERVQAVKVGDKVELVTTPDFNIRDKALDKILKLGRYYPDTKIQIDKHETKTYGIEKNTIDALKERHRAQQTLDTTCEVVNG